MDAAAPKVAPPDQPPDHRQVVGRLTRDQRRALLRRSDAAGLWHLAGHLGAIAVIGALIVLAVPGWPVLLLPHGILVVFLFCLVHEAVHKTPFHSAWLNHAAAWGAGLVYLLPPTWFHHFHMDHHRYTQDPERDPELARPLPKSRWGLVWYIAGGPFWISQIRTLLVNAAGGNADTFIPDRDRALVAWEARLFLLAYAGVAAASVALGSLLVVWLWLVPLLIGQPFMRLYLLAEHTGCPHVPDMLQNTRTTFTNPLIRYIAWNMPYHIEHHAYPAVPFHQLPKFHALIRPHLKVTAKGYGRATQATTRAILRGKP